MEREYPSARRVRLTARFGGFERKDLAGKQDTTKKNKAEDEEGGAVKTA
jgi:hypothetical protein